MAAPELIRIARVGGAEEDGWYRVLVKAGYAPLLHRISDVYLIFEENRVFYVTISDRKEEGKKTWLRFAEDGIDTERRLHKEVSLAIDSDLDDSSDDDELSGRDVVYKDSLLGIVVDSYFNGAQDVLIIATDGELEIMIPYVEHYIQSDSYPDAIILRNVDELLAHHGLYWEAGVLISKNASD